MGSDHIGPGMDRKSCPEQRRLITTGVRKRDLQFLQSGVYGSGQTPRADVYLAPSTYQCMGDTDTLRISDTRNTLLWFDLSGIPSDATVTLATLRLYVYAEYGGGTLSAGVFRCDQGHDLPPSNPLTGLATVYPYDQEIISHPDVYLFSDFETNQWGDDWTFGTNAATLDRVLSDPGQLFEPLRGSALRIKMTEGGHYEMSVGFDFADEIGQEPEEIYFRYYLRFANDWETVYGGKMPGISGTYGRAGWGGRLSDGTNGWSARGSFNVMPPRVTRWERPFPWVFMSIMPI